MNGEDNVTGMGDGGNGRDSMFNATMQRVYVLLWMAGH